MFRRLRKRWLGLPVVIWLLLAVAVVGVAAAFFFRASFQATFDTQTLNVQILDYGIADDTVPSAFFDPNDNGSDPNGPWDPNTYVPRATGNLASDAILDLGGGQFQVSITDGYPGYFSNFAVYLRNNGPDALTVQGIGNTLGPEINVGLGNALCGLVLPAVQVDQDWVVGYLEITDQALPNTSYGPYVINLDLVASVDFDPALCP